MIRGFGLLRSSSARHVFKDVYPTNRILGSAYLSTSTANPLPAPSTTKTRQQHQNEQKSRHSEEQRKKMGNYYSMFIASAVGIIGSSYILFQRFSKVEAKELLEDESALDIVDGDASKKSSGQEMTLHKSQAGFRERKVHVVDDEVIFVFFGVHKN